MALMGRWRKEPGARVEGSRPLDSSKVQAPGVVRLPGGGFRLFYTAVGPAKPFPACQGYILSAVSDDGLAFRPEPGIRVAPDPSISHLSLRAIGPSLVRLGDGRWRMYFEARGPASRPAVICSAVSSDLLAWEVEPGIRLEAFEGVGAPRYVPLPGGGGTGGGSEGGRGAGGGARLYCFASRTVDSPGGGTRRSQSIVSATTADGLRFELEPGIRLLDGFDEQQSAGITAAEVVAPAAPGEHWLMVYSAWQDVPPGTVVPPHPSQDPDAVAKGLSADFAAASIAADMAGYRSRIFLAVSADGLAWERTGLLVEGDGYGGVDLDAVHAEDMCLVQLDDGRWRMYYAACDARGVWRVASAVTEG